MAKTYTLRNIPPEVYEIVQKEQASIKQKKQTNLFSFERTIYKMIKDYEKCRTSSPTFKPDDI